MVCHRKNHSKLITHVELSDMKKSIKKFHRRFIRVLVPSMEAPDKAGSVRGKAGKTQKYHRLSHKVQCARRLGKFGEYDAQFYEASNKQQKTSYQTTNKKKTNDRYVKQMADHQAMRLALSERSTFNPDAVVHNRNNTYLKAFELQENCLAQKPLFTLRTDGSAPRDGELNAKQARKFIAGLGDFDKVCKAVNKAFNGTFPDIMPRATGALTARVPWLVDSNELHTIRATPSFHGKPYFDTVMYLKDGDRREKCGRLRLLFTAQKACGERLKLVCIQKMIQSPSSYEDDLIKAGCIHVTLSDSFIVVPLSCLLRRVYAVPDFSIMDPAKFHLCKWKWNRSPAQDKDLE